MDKIICDFAKANLPAARTLATKTMESIFNYFDSFIKLSQESKELMATHLEFETIRKNDYLWKAGQRCENIYFIKSGVVRLFFYNEQGEENTVHFISPNKVIADVDSLNMNTPSSVSCAASIDTEVVVLTAPVTEKFNREVFEWNELKRKITEKSLFDKIKTRDKIFQKEAKERYLSFLEHFPLVASNVQASHIASYLGISQFTLSHIKGELSKSHFLRKSKN